MPFDNAVAFVLWLVAILPGLLSLKVYDLLVPGDDRAFPRTLFDAATYSALNFAVFSWKLVPAAIVAARSASLERFAATPEFRWTLALSVVPPLLWPMGFVFLSKLRPISRHIVPPVRRPWDDVFGRRQKYHVIVHLKDGRRVGGFYGDQSSASVSAAEEQLYLQQVWELSDDGHFLRPVTDSAGILLGANSFWAVVFFVRTEERSGEHGNDLGSASRSDQGDPSHGD